MTGLDRDMADYIARCMRQIHGVETVFTVESRRSPPREPTAMSFADHIRACNNADPARLVPLLASDGRRIGWLLPDNAAALSRFPGVFAVERSASGLSPRAMSMRSAPPSMRLSRRSSSRSKSRNGATKPLTSWRAGAKSRYFGSIAARCRFSACAPMACI